MNISLYETEVQSKNGKQIPIELILGAIKDGKYRQKVEAIRLQKSNFKLEDERVGEVTRQEKQKDDKWKKAYEKLKALKGDIPRVTISGTFSEAGRSMSNMTAHSGLIDMDIDGLSKDELSDLRQKLCMDKYCFACFITCGEDGLSFIVKIDGGRHTDSFDGLVEYLYKQYGVTGVDEVHKSFANTRNLSYDPLLFTNPLSQKFKEYPKKEKPKQVLKFVHAQTDFDEIIKEIERQALDFCDTYENYRNIGFAIGSKFGAAGENYFHAVAQFNLKYNYDKVKRDFRYFCNNKSTGISIGTFYARCKDFRIEITSTTTKLISQIASVARKTGKTKEDTIKNLEKHEGLERTKTEDIVNQVFDEKIEIEDSTSIIAQIKAWLRHDYDLRLNEVNNLIESKGICLDDRALNSIYVEAKTIFGKEANTNLLNEIIFSDFVTSYNPFQEYFNAHEQDIPLFDSTEIPQVVLDLWDTFTVPDKQYLIKYGTKYLVGIIAASHGVISPLMMILQGGQGVGKSEFIHRLLPKELEKYVTPIKWNKGKDDEITLCQYLICLDDEVEHQSKKTQGQIKAILSEKFYNIRLPYGRISKKMKRIAVLFGTSNPMSLLSDATGNRRFIPVNVLGRDFKKFDAIDKDVLFMALYQMYKNGFDWEVKESDIEDLKSKTEQFNAYSMEYELLNQYFCKPTALNSENLTATEIKVYLELKSNQKLKISQLSQELTRLGIEKSCVRVNGVPKHCYILGSTDKVEGGPF